MYSLFCEWNGNIAKLRTLISLVLKEGELESVAIRLLGLMLSPLSYNLFLKDHEPKKSFCAVTDQSGTAATEKE